MKVVQSHLLRAALKAVMFWAQKQLQTRLSALVLHAGEDYIRLAQEARKTPGRSVNEQP